MAYVAHDRLLALDHIQRLCALTARLDLAPGPGGSRMSDHRSTLDALGSEIATLFPGVVTRATISTLYPSSQLVGHCDPPCAGGGTRYHIPIQMNDGCWVFHDGTWSQLELGRTYEMDPTLTHGAVNWGSTVRLHLLVDIS